MGSDNSQSQVDYRDYLIIRLVSGRIEAELMFNGVASNIVQLAGSDMLNDGKWHAVTLMQIGKVCELESISRLWLSFFRFSSSNTHHFHFLLIFSPKCPKINFQHHSVLSICLSIIRC